jgi:hypothetical protein
MIQLHDDYLFFQMSSGETIPCSVEVMAVELVGDAVSNLDPVLLREATSAVLHYFKHDLGQSSVSIADFSLALERVLRAFGLNVKADEGRQANVADLRELAGHSGEVFELAFFPRLRDELRNRLKTSPEMLAFRGLRDCVKGLLGAKRWNNRCQQLNDQIVEYLRQCLQTESNASSCGLIVR